VSDGSEVDDDLAFVAKARDALADGLALLYVSWRRRSCAGPVNPSPVPARRSGAMRASLAGQGTS